MTMHHPAPTHLVEDAGGDDLEDAGEDGGQLGRLLLLLLHLQLVKKGGQPA